jgi:hypothetical protein
MTEFDPRASTPVNHGVCLRGFARTPSAWADRLWYVFLNAVSPWFLPGVLLVSAAHVRHSLLVARLVADYLDVAALGTTDLQVVCPGCSGCFLRSAAVVNKCSNPHRLPQTLHNRHCKERKTFSTIARSDAALAGVGSLAGRFC